MFLHLLRPGPSQPLTVKNVTNLLKPEFSEEGSNSRTFENVVYAKFMKYLREAASKSIEQFSADGLHLASPKDIVDAKPIAVQPPNENYS